MMFSVNNRLILEPYVKSGLKSEVRNGIATPGQRDGLKGLKVLMDVRVMDGGEPRYIPKGSIAYIREEILHSHPWGSKHLTCDTHPGKYMVVDLSYVEFIETFEPSGDAA